VPFRIVSSQIDEHPDAPHPLALLRARRERPPGRRSAQEGDELPPFHSPTSPVLPTERIAHLGTEEAAALRNFNAAHYRSGVIHVIRGIPARPVRPNSGHSANARVYKYAAYGAAENKSLENHVGRRRLSDRTS
jgi:hypothetical protein